LRCLVIAAKSIQSKRGRVVLLSPQPLVEEVIQTSGVDELIAVHQDETAAIAAVLPV